MPINNNDILHTLEKMRPNKSVCLSVAEKQKMLKAIFETPVSTPVVQAVRTPFFSLFTRYAVYALPAFILGFIGLQYGEAMLLKAKLAYQDFYTTQSEVKLSQVSLELQNSLLQTTKDITTLKSFEATGVDAAEKAVLVSQVSSGSKSIRNQVAALVKENKITEAKEVVLTLETALKADELYKVAPAVQTEITAATDLRVKLEKKETLATTEASTTASTTTTLASRIEADTEEISTLKATESTSELILDAKRYLDKSAEYLKNNDVEKAIISLQTHDRIVAEAKLILLK